MFLKALQKSVLMGGAGGAIYLANSIDVSDTLTSKHFDLQNASFNKSISRLEDIELFEKLHGCSFVFVGTWSEQKTWNFKEFLKKYPWAGWVQRVIKGADSTKDYCKDKKIATLAFNSRKTAFELKTS